jgi:glucose-6-phosphate 1-epimerase
MTVAIRPGRGGLSLLRIDCGFGTAELYLHGAHTTSWIPAGGSEMLFVSPAAVFAPGASIRGGVPIAFPQFAELGLLPMHGFAHVTPWAWSAASDNGAVLTLHDSEWSRSMWPHRFVAEVAVELGALALSIVFRVRNAGDRPLSWSGTLHTFLALHARETTIHGLGPGRFLDRGSDGGLIEDPAGVFSIPGHTDRAYLDAGPVVMVDDGERRLLVAKDGFRDTVVWNPGPETSSRFPDLLQDDHQRFTCVEAAEVRPVTVAPGVQWEGRQTLTIAGPQGSGLSPRAKNRG